MVFHSDDEIVVSVAEDSTLRVWRAKGGSVGQPLLGHDDWISAVAVADESEIAVTGSKDGTIRVWDLKNASKGLDEWLEEVCPWLLGHSISFEPEASSPVDSCIDLHGEALSGQDVDPDADQGQVPD